MQKMLKGWGLDGVVCSPLEAGKVKEACGAQFLTVTPGVRFADGDNGDQVRSYYSGSRPRNRFRLYRCRSPHYAGCRSGCCYIGQMCTGIFRIITWEVFAMKQEVAKFLLSIHAVFLRPTSLSPGPAASKARFIVITA